MKAVPSAHNIAWVERTIGYQSIDQLALAEGAHNDTVLAQTVGAAHDLWLFARDSLDIRAQGARRVLLCVVVLGVHIVIGQVISNHHAHASSLVRMFFVAVLILI